MRTQREKAIARIAFDKAYTNECNNMIESVKEKANNLSGPRGVWELGDYLDHKRNEMDQKHDYRYSVLIHVFGRLVGEGGVEMKDLEGLEEEKIQRIRFIAGVDAS